MRAYLLLMAIAAVVTYLATFAVRKLADKYEIYPKAIRARDMHTKPTARIGGAAMFIGFLASIAIAALIGWFGIVFADPGPIIAISVAALIVMAIGFLDDLYDLDWTIKLAGQFLAAGVLAWNGVQIVSLPIFGITVGSFGVSFVVTVFLAVLIMNAVNFIDGLDGLVAGVVLIGTVVFFIYSYLLAQQVSPTNYFNLATMLSAIVIGMCIGFLPHNWHVAKIFMGDGGALLLGLLMTTSALTVTGQIDPASLNRDDLVPAVLPLILPISILVLPLLDFALAVLRRVSAGKSPFAADKKHLHHRLQDFGHTHLGSVLVFYFWSASVSVSCLLLFLTNIVWVAVFAVISITASLLYTVWPAIIKARKQLQHV
ncbi:MAG: undecaprenyl/decaprenyl-phosphate alpha-N-acetylglucosaminyl 1-phosphate transferase [Micrococcales bacterium]|nr:undecaprenyl/decaprenyl-phosphate alpha-N-acetylglucosaminyl 1-phosphate transferase [Actinomycetota bacterium]NCA08183.1 undecaprenyl/decaprenyl-phosphate alpha-N-acetylglucosaminyl 1-phosphate transferase [Micrococcales bacterium]